MVYRAGLSCVEIRHRDRAGSSQTAGSHPCACADLLHGLDPLPCHAHAPEGPKAQCQPPHCAGSACTHPKAHCPYRRPHFQRDQQNHSGAARSLRGYGPQKTRLTGAVVTQTQFPCEQYQSLTRLTVEPGLHASKSTLPISATALSTGPAKPLRSSSISSRLWASKNPPDRRCSHTNTISV
jgi:hypothetical protein